MRSPQKRCFYCGRWFRPDPRTAAQKACGGAECRRMRHARACQSWRIRFPKDDEARRGKTRAWAKTYPDYWRHYRTGHPSYVRRDNRRRQRRRRAG
ncbi:MAG: hypothetical protein IPN19_04805 [Elusimicrobia bacterium]|nr:hypothetical protein [Elusimicrobiota bacterium]